VISSSMRQMTLFSGPGRETRSLLGLRSEGLTINCFVSLTYVPEKHCLTRRAVTSYTR
jgi:hypothetical protein